MEAYAIISIQTASPALDFQCLVFMTDELKTQLLFVDGNELLLPYDKPLFEWLCAAGFAPQRDRRRLSEQLRANSAQGAGGHGHSHNHHGHTHNHN